MKADAPITEVRNDIDRLCPAKRQRRDERHTERARGEHPASGLRNRPRDGPLAEPSAGSWPQPAGRPSSPSASCR